ncbi:U-box domain-containing protein 32 isoform X1 [Jatropha curcas]|uniref:U-box domain-containing protein 32 isoform X1 n=1 Tax=Jatropha curcas TaxID=180498 RepID=UPI0005FB5A71|nr:U-box domain-containing protein 32 isoform X1 [Jatropha curcas]
MGSVDEIVKDRAHDLEDTIFVAVGKNVEKSKTTLFWAVQSFAGKKIFVLHVHQPASAVSLTDRKLAVSKQKQEMIKAIAELEKKKMLDVLNQYCSILAHGGVKADKVWIEMENIEKGIVEIIAQYNIRWLVMGAAADKYYSKKLTGLKSKKAIFVCQHAPISCHIWFACKGCLIYTREGRNDKSEPEIASLLLLDCELRNEQPEYLRLGSFTQTCGYVDAVEGPHDLEGILGRFNYECAVHSSQSSNMVLRASKMMPLIDEFLQEEKSKGKTTEKPYHELQQTIVDSKDSKKKAFEEAVKRWKEEDNAMEAKCKAKALEKLCIKEISLRKEMEEELARENEVVERTQNQCDEFIEEVQMVQEQKSVLESQLSECNCMVKDLEEKIISAVELLISFKAKRDAARIEYENAMREVIRLRKLAKMETVSFSKSEILEFSFMEINEATQEFDPSWKIGEGRYGIVYKGILRHVHVAIKMLPSYGSHTQLDFQNGVEILSRVRHPHLVTLIGTCPESRSLVYEYVRNGSLEDCLACKNKTMPLPWKARLRIATEICSALIFLHSKKPCIIHGNLKPSKILLDADYVSKLSGVGVTYLMPQGERLGTNIPISNRSNSNFMSVYADPEYLDTGTLTPESDVYSFGMILLRLLTGRPVSGLVKNVKCALEKENLKALLDCSSGDWPVEQAKMLAKLALRCCENYRMNRPDVASEILCVLETMRASCVDLASCLDSKELHRVPSHFICPIFQEVMKDPQIAADGFTYDAEAIRGWLKSGHNTSPMTNLKLEHCNLLPNHALHQAIQEWRRSW